MKLTLTILVVALIAIAILLAYRAGQEPEVVEDSQTIHLSRAITEKLEIVPLSVGNDKSYEAVRVQDVCDLFEIDMSQITLLDFVSGDGMNIQIPIEELPDLFLAINEDDTFRLVIPTDEFHQRWLKNINKIVLQ